MWRKTKFCVRVNNMWPGDRPKDAPPVDPHYGNFTHYGKSVVHEPEPMPYDLTPDQKAAAKKDWRLIDKFLAENLGKWLGGLTEEQRKLMNLPKADNKEETMG